MVNASISYSDSEGNAVTFPFPSVEVSCSTVITPEGCPVPVNFSVEGCRDFAVVDLGDVYLEAQGRIVELNMTIKNVCPHKRVALAVILSEVDCHGTEHRRGLKTFSIPAHGASSCRDVLVKCIRFILPEDNAAPSTCSTDSSLCRTRNLKARIMAHYIDTDYDCCGSVI